MFNSPINSKAMINFDKVFSEESIIHFDLEWKKVRDQFFVSSPNINLPQEEN